VLLVLYTEISNGSHGEGHLTTAEEQELRTTKSENLKGIIHVGDLDVNMRITLKRIVDK
jgi:hypothetical protein